MKNILVTGSTFVNRGSEAMMYVAADELKKRFPDMQVVMLSPFDFRKDTSIYNFKILPDYIGRYLPEPFRTVRKIVKKVFGVTANIKEEQKYKNEFEEAVRNAAFLVNIGGYALSSQKESNLKKPWGTICYLTSIMFCKKKGIPIYLMPQSFGPFVYIWPYKAFINYMMNKYLKYPRLIFAREKEGYDYMKPFCQKNKLFCINDTVLTNKNMDFKNIFKNMDTLNMLKIKEKEAVAVIPNKRCVDIQSEHKVVSVYINVIDILLKKQKVVYLLRHSKEDLELCKKLKEHYKCNKSVYLMSGELNCFEMQHFLKQFSFVVASRYHAIIHSFLQETPCMIIGWATKYKELAILFGQEQLWFDIRDEITADELSDKINYINAHIFQERKTIHEHLETVKKQNAYDYVEQDYRKEFICEK